MALGETSMANTQEEAAAGALNNQMSETGSNLDFSGVNDFFDNYNGFNVAEIQKDEPQQFGNNTTTKTEAGTEVTDQTTIAPNPKADVNALYQKGVNNAKSYQASVPIKFLEARNPALAAGNFEFGSVETNVDRYRGYGKETFNRIGFNPLEENEMHFTSEGNATGWQDLKRMTGQYGTLFRSSFSSNYNAIGNFFSGKVGLVDPDIKAAEEFERAMALGSSSRNTPLGKLTNFSLNTAYAIGIAANVAFEETLIWMAGLAAAPFTEGASIGVAAGATVVEGVEAANALRKLRMMYSAAFRGKEIGQMAKGGMQILKSLGRAEDSRAFWRMSRAGWKNFGRGAAGFVNPFRQGMEAVAGIRANAGAYRNLSNFAKATRTFGGFYRDIRENTFAVGESQLEGGGTFNDIVQSEIELWQKKNNTTERPPESEMKRIYQDAESGGRLDTIINIPMIFLSNRVVFDGLFNFKGVKSLTDLSEAAFAQGFGNKTFFNLAGKTYQQAAKGAFNEFKTAMKVFRNPKVYAGTFLTYTRKNFMEGVQESLQETTAGSIRNYYTNLYQHPTQGGNHLIMSSIGQSISEDLWSWKGLETFISGFAMGGVMGPGGKIVKNLAVGTKQYLWGKVRPESYKAYKAQRDLMRTQAVDALNQILPNSERLFSRRSESIVTQVNANNNMSSATLNNDDKTFYDSKDDKTFDHVFTALDNGTFSQVIDGLKQIGTLDEQEIADYFGLESGTKAKEKVVEYIERATQIKERYNTIQEKFPNPFNPARFSKNTPLRIREFIAHKAFEDAKKTAIASQYGFERAVERMNSTFNDISKNSPLTSASASDFTVLQNENSLKTELKVLKGEIETLNQGGAEEKRAAKQKQTKYDIMVEYLDHLKRYNREKEGATTDQNGKVVIPYNEHLLDPLRDTFYKYIKVIAKMNNEVNIFDDKINSAFDKIADYYSLNEDAGKYAEVINHLSNPANLLRYADAAQETLVEIFNNKEQLVSNAVDKYIGIHELNSLMQVIEKMGAIINPAEVEALYNTGKLPSSFFDLKNNKVIDRKDARYPTLISMVENFSKIVRNASEEEEETPDEFKAEKTEEEKQAEAEAAAAEEAARKKAEEEAAAQAAANGTQSTEVMDAELESRLRKAYEQYLLSGNPDVTFEEYVKNFGSAQRVKEEYEREKAAKAAGKTKGKYTDLKTLDDKVNWIKANTRIKRDAFNTDQEFVDYFEKQRNAIIESIKDGKSKEDILTANGAVIANITDINKAYSDLLKEYSIEEPAAPPPPAGPKPKTEAELAKEEAQAIIDEIKSLKELPNLKGSDNKESTARILELIGLGNLKSIDVINMIEAKRLDLIKNLTINDLEKGDFITFTDGRQGWITSTTRSGSVQLKIIGTAKGEYEIMDISDIIKNIKMLEEGKKVSPEPVEEVIITPEEQEAAEASRDVMSEFISNVAELQKINEENEKNLTTDNSGNEDDLLNELGCNTKPA